MELNMYTDEIFMNEALKEAKKAQQLDEVPVGAIVVCNNKIIARAHNLSEQLNDVTAHAEMQAYTAASNYLGSKFLNDCTLYVTLEPCVMCAGASYWTRIGKIVFGAIDKKRGFQKINQSLLHTNTQIEGGVMEKECSEILSEYFKTKR